MIHVVPNYTTDIYVAHPVRFIEIDENYNVVGTKSAVIHVDLSRIIAWKVHIDEDIHEDGAMPESIPQPITADGHTAGSEFGTFIYDKSDDSWSIIFGDIGEPGDGVQGIIDYCNNALDAVEKAPRPNNVETLR